MAVSAAPAGGDVYAAAEWIIRLGLRPRGGHDGLFLLLAFHEVLLAPRLIALVAVAVSFVSAVAALWASLGYNPNCKEKYAGILRVGSNGGCGFLFHAV